MSENELTAVYASLPGGPELLAFFGEVPVFHDGEVLDLHLNRTGPSTLRVHTWSLQGVAGAVNTRELEKQAVVTFTIEEIADLKLEGFSHQNVICGLIVRRVRATTPNFGMTWMVPPPPGPDLYEIELEPTYGLAGTIRAARVSISYEVCMPLSERVRQILFEVWDPIGIRDTGAPRDEYDTYEPAVTQMIMIGAEDDQIAQHLLKIEQEQMGLTPSPSRAQAVARRLVQLRSAPDT